MNPNDLVCALGNPRADEFAYEQHIARHAGRSWAAIDRLEALAELKHLADAGKIAAPGRRRGANTHVHTNESFSIFRSPCEAAWQGFVEGLDVLGINDHYTIGGHDEFRDACRLLGLRATFSMEAVALDEGCQERGIRCNDPGNAGRTYLSAKGVLHDLPRASQGRADLNTMRKSLTERNRRMVEKLNGILTDLTPRLELGFDAVLALTPRGNTTERHVCQALAELIDSALPDRGARSAFLRSLVGELDEADTQTSAAYQNMLRAKLVKAGGPAYVEESPEAFVSWQRMISMYLEFGAIPSYPVLGNPVVELEEDIDGLFCEIERHGMYAIEVIPHRNEHDRLAAILDAAAGRNCPVFNGTEHNTKTPMPLLDRWSGSDEFIGQFERGADVLIGHQVLGGYAGFGYVLPDGSLSVPDRAYGLELFGFAGRMIQKPETLRLLAGLGSDAALRLLAGLFAVAPAAGAWSIAGRAAITAAQLAGVQVQNGAASFASPADADFLANWSGENMIV